MLPQKFRSARAVLSPLSALTLILLTPVVTLAQVFHGGDIRDGVPLAEGINTGGSSNIRETVIEIVRTVLSYMGLIAVIVIVIAGIYLVVGGGSDNARQMAIKVVIYTIVGFLVILLAGAFVTFVISAGTSA